jgi:hypothetical protein
MADETLPYETAKVIGPEMKTTSVRVQVLYTRMLARTSTSLYKKKKKRPAQPRALAQKFVYEYQVLVACPCLYKSLSTS